MPAILHRRPAWTFSRPPVSGTLAAPDILGMEMGGTSGRGRSPPETDPQAPGRLGVDKQSQQGLLTL